MYYLPKDDDFPFKLKTLRKERGLTQFELARKAGLHLWVIQRFESGERLPSLYTLQNLARILKVSIDDIYRNPLPDNILSDTGKHIS